MEFTRKSKWSGKVRTMEIPEDVSKQTFLQREWLETGMTPEEIDDEQESRIASDENKRYHK